MPSHITWPEVIFRLNRARAWLILRSAFVADNSHYNRSSCYLLRAIRTPGLGRNGGPPSSPTVPDVVFDTSIVFDPLKAGRSEDGALEDVRGHDGGLVIEQIRHSIGLPCALFCSRAPHCDEGEPGRPARGFARSDGLRIKHIKHFLCKPFNSEEVG